MQSDLSDPTLGFPSLDPGSYPNPEQSPTAGIEPYYVLVGRSPSLPLRASQCLLVIAIVNV